MLNTYNNNNTHSVVMNPPCMGTLQKTHPKSKFKKFHANSPLADLVFSTNPRMAKDSLEIIVLQIMCFGDYEFSWSMLIKKIGRNEAMTK